MGKRSVLMVENGKDNVSTWVDVIQEFPRGFSLNTGRRWDFGDGENKVIVLAFNYTGLTQEGAKIIAQHYRTTQASCMLYDGIQASKIHLIESFTEFREVDLND